MINQKLSVEISDELKNKFSQGSDFRVGGVFSVEHIRDGEVISTEVSPNIVVNEGLDYILDAAMSSGTQNLTFYIGIFKNNYTPQATNVMSTFAGAGVAGEVSTEIDNASRPTWIEAGVSSRTITNTASPAAFTANASVSVYGAFLSTNSTLGGTSGILIAASKFSAVRSLVDDDVLNVTYTLTIADA